MNNIENLIEKVLNAQDVVPLIKEIILTGPPSRVSDALRESARTWSEPQPTSKQVQATQLLYESEGEVWDRLDKVFDALILNLKLRESLKEMS